MSLRNGWIVLLLLGIVLALPACGDDDDDDDTVNDDDIVDDDDTVEECELTQADCADGEELVDADTSDCYCAQTGCADDEIYEEATDACCPAPMRQVGGPDACGIEQVDCPDGTTLTDAGSPDCYCMRDCGNACPLPADAESPEWISFGHDLANTRAVEGPVGIAPENVARLERLWVHEEVESTSTPAVRDGIVYFADWAGHLHAKNVADGTEVWTADLGRTATPTPLVTEDYIYIGDGRAYLHKLNRDDGSEVWVRQYDDHPMANFTGSVVEVPGENLLLVGISSGEVGQAPIGEDGEPYDYFFRGSVLGIDADDGDIRWRTYLTDDDECSGAGVSIWSSPAVDLERGMMYIGTGQTYVEPDSPYADGMVALDMMTGEMIWARQFTADDIYTLFDPPPQGPDADVGAAPSLWTANGRDMVGVGDKAGVFSVLDRDTGETVWAKILSPGSHLGGIMAASAYADGVVFAASNTWPTGLDTANIWIPDFGNEENTTTVYALDAGTGDTLWSRDVQYPTIGGLMVASGLLYVGTTLGWTYAFDVETGDILWADRTGSTLASGKSIYDGVLLTTFGFQFIGIQGEADTAAGGLVAYAPRTEEAVPPFDLTLVGDGFDPHVGQQIGIAIGYAGADEPIWVGGVDSLGGPAFTFHWPVALQAGQAYQLDIYADLNGSGGCDAPPTDHGWRIPIAPTSHAVTIDLRHNVNFEPTVCETFD